MLLSFDVIMIWLSSFEVAETNNKFVYVVIISAIFVNSIQSSSFLSFFFRIFLFLLARFLRMIPFLSQQSQQWTFKQKVRGTTKIDLNFYHVVCNDADSLGRDEEQC